jgi:hypothetical protein
LAFRYFWTAALVAVPSEPDIASTWSSSTSLRVCSTVLGGLKPSSSEIMTILRPFTPPWSLIMAK